MKISIFGLGYVGTVSAGCLAKEGHAVIGVDSNQTKVDLINAGKSPIIEKDIDGIIGSAVSSKTLGATMDASSAVFESEISLVCVGTPSQSNGDLDLQYVESVCEEIGKTLAGKALFHVVVVRSTMLPGSARSVVIPALEYHSGKIAGKEFGVCINPEFLREGTAVYDYNNPPKTLIAESDTKSGDMLAEIYADLSAPLIRTSIETVEMVKYADNAWHALKIGFANEIGNICKSVDIDSHEVMDIFCKDTKLNLSSCYLKPGFAFGGSCLPKDVRALTYKARSMDLDTPILSSIMPSNQQQIERGLSMIVAQPGKKIGFLGFSFKAGTDDLRESPVVYLIEQLIGKGYDLRLYDKNVIISGLVGANRDYLLNHIPHISGLMVDTIEEVLGHADTIVIGNNSEEFSEVPTNVSDSQVIVDLVRVMDGLTTEHGYQGICW